MQSWSKKTLFVLLWVATVIYILLLPTRHYTPDAVNNLTYLEAYNVFESLHSQHLLGLTPAVAVYYLTDLRAWQTMRVTQAVLAGLTVALLFAGLEELTQRRRLAIILSLVLWFSYGFWHYSSDPDIYSLGYVAVALLMWGYVRFLRSPSYRRVVVLGLCGALALLSHQMNIELAGLIGLSLIVAVLRSSPQPSKLFVSWSHVTLYVLFSLLPTAMLYGASWLTVSNALVQQGSKFPTFAEWFLRYFQTADAGQATWGVSLSLSTLPTAIYTFVSSWVLVPLIDEATVLQLLPLGILMVLVLLSIVHILSQFRVLDRVTRYVLSVCLLTLIANILSGWWWQTGNIKFYLFIQVNLIFCVGIYVSRIVADHPFGHIRRLILPLAALGLLMTFHLLWTLPYETSGGVFRVARLFPGASTQVAFEDKNQARLFPYLSPNTATTLPDDFCETSSLPVTVSQSVWWVIQEDTLVDCVILHTAAEVDRFQTDGTRTTWLILDMTPRLKTK